MLLRICLVLAILAGLGVAGVSQFVLRPQIEQIIQTRDDNKKGWDKAEGELRTTKKNLKDTKEKLTKTESTLQETKTQLTDVTGKFENEQKKSADLEKKVAQISAHLKSALDDLAAWTNSNVTVDQVRTLVADLKKAQTDKEALQQENKVLNDKIKKQEERIASLLGGEGDPPMPAELRGKVLVVDPKWEFVILNIGTSNAVKERGVLLVSRKGDLVAKVRVVTASDQRSIANIMPGYKIDNVMEGDIVLPY